MLDSDKNDVTNPRKRMTVFRGKDAFDVTKCMPMEGVDDSVKAGFAKLRAARDENVHGETALCVFQEPGENGMSLCYSWFKSNYVLPRHSHNADCVYYVTGGELRMGNTVLHKGDGVFVPADHAYTFSAGPDGVEFIEVRNGNKFNMVFKGNDEAHWDRIADACRANKDAWAQETVPPSDRGL